MIFISYHRSFELLLEVLRDLPKTICSIKAEGIRAEINSSNRLGKNEKIQIAVRYKHIR